MAENDGIRKEKGKGEKKEKKKKKEKVKKRQVPSYDIYLGYSSCHPEEYHEIFGYSSQRLNYSTNMRVSFKNMDVAEFTERLDPSLHPVSIVEMDATYQRRFA